MMYTRMYENVKTLNIVDDLVYQAIKQEHDIFRHTAAYLLDKDYDVVEPEESVIVRNYMIGGDKSSFDGTFNEMIRGRIRKMFPYTLDCDIEKDVLTDDEIMDGCIEAVTFILPKYKREIIPDQMSKHRPRNVYDTLDYIRCERKNVETAYKSLDKSLCFQLRIAWLPRNICDFDGLKISGENCKQGSIVVIRGTRDYILDQLDRLETIVKENTDILIYD